MSEMEQYLIELQGNVDALKSALIEYDSIAAHATDPLTKDALSRGRGYLASQIEGYRSEWVRYSTHPSMGQAEYEKRVGLLKL